MNTAYCRVEVLLGTTRELRQKPPEASHSRGPEGPAAVGEMLWCTVGLGGGGETKGGHLSLLEGKHKRISQAEAAMMPSPAMLIMEAEPSARGSQMSV